MFHYADEYIDPSYFYDPNVEELMELDNGIDIMEAYTDPPRRPVDCIAEARAEALDRYLTEALDHFAAVAERTPDGVRRVA
jgi:hypothetical protein